MYTLLLPQVEPFNRALVDSQADVMVNGRRQDHGFERAHIEVSHAFCLSPRHCRAAGIVCERRLRNLNSGLSMEVFEGGKPVKCNPLAYWTFKDCFDYLESENLEKHPLHDQARSSQAIG